MLAFAKDISQNQPKHPREDEDSELKQYMAYQRRLNHNRLVYYSLEHGVTQLKKCVKAAKGNADTLYASLGRTFPHSREFADPETLMKMLRDLAEAHQSTTQWYQMNAYYSALVYDCMHDFVQVYNQLVAESPVRAEVYYISEGDEIDFNDWTYLYFPNLDFLIPEEPEAAQYPFAKRNQAIQTEMENLKRQGKSSDDALNAVQQEFQIDATAIHVIQDQAVQDDELQLLHTSMGNPIYDYLTQKRQGDWEALDGESILDQAYALGAQLKVWVWKKRKRAKK